MSSSQAMLMSQGLSMFDHHEEEEEEENNMSNTTTTQMGFFSSFPPNMSLLLPPFIPQSLKTLIPTLPPPSNNNILTDQIIISSSSKQRSEEDHINTSHLGGGPQLSLQRSSANLWAWGEVNECMSINKRSGGGVTSGCGGGGGGDEEQQHLIGVSAMKMKKINMKARRKVREPRFCFKTLSDVDVLDDGYKWRKYGQKVVKNTQHPRSYYRCTQDNCRVKKRVERLAEDPRMVITTYEGRHAHSPSHDEDDNSQAPNSLLDNFFF